MTENLGDAVDAAREELIRRLTDDDEIQSIPTATLVRILEGLERRARISQEKETAEVSDPVEFVRQMGLPEHRQVEALAQLAGVSADEAASMLAASESEVDNGEPGVSG